MSDMTKITAQVSMLDIQDGVADMAYCVSPNAPFEECAGYVLKFLVIYASLLASIGLTRDEYTTMAGAAFDAKVKM